MSFKGEFMRLVKKYDPSWMIEGAVSKEGLIYTFGTDTKVLSTLFELIVTPIIEEIAERNKLIFETSPSQTIYPDFTLSKPNSKKDRIAIDVKTTYRKYNVKKDIKPFGFTLGSYTSFLRNNTKNILHPYNEYSEHWIIGFVYDRNPKASEGIFELKDINKIIHPYGNVKFFVQEKYKISGEKPGSGNTANMGSILTSNMKDFEKGRGPFAKLGEKTFQEYWASYGRTTDRPYNNLKEFFKWRKNKT
jgi:hypothetical protein